MKNHVFRAALAAGLLGCMGTGLAQTDPPVQAKAKIKGDKVKIEDVNGDKHKLTAKKGTVKTKQHTSDGKMKAKTETDKDKGKDTDRR
jgi:hypothetical protein